MSAEIPAEALQLRSLVRADQTLELFLDMVPVSEPGPDEVVIRVEAAPLNPSDMGLLFGGADMAAAVASGSAERPVVTAPIPDAAMRGLAGRVGTPMPVGNEGAGTVVAAGESPAAQALLGKVVAAAGGGMYSQDPSGHVMLCLGLPAGGTAVEGAAPFVKPMTGVRKVADIPVGNPHRPGRLCWARSSLRRAAECTRSTGRSTSCCAWNSRPERRRSKAQPRS